MNLNNLETMYRGWGGVFSGEFQACPKCEGTGHAKWAHGVVGNCTHCHGFGVIEVEPSTAPDLVEVVGDTLPDDVAAILALTPHVDETADWAEREAAAKEADKLAAVSMTDSWGWCFAEKPLNMDANGDVWA